MKLLKVVFLFTSLFFLSTFTKGASLSDFPDGWLGKWTGKLLIYGEGEPKEVYMELNIKDADEVNHWKWTIIYGKGEFGQTRAYELILIDSAKGKFKMDEKNSILLDMTYRNNSFFSTFEVEKNLVTAVYTLIDNKIIFEIISSDMKNPLVTGNEGEEVSTVFSYPVTVVQKAELNKYNE
jgi:hypothetical protein